jgi:hypothetical protein
MRVRIYLRQTLFALPGSDAHVPHTAMVLDAEITEQGSGGITVKVSDYFDERGRKLEGATARPRTLILPMAKIDHLQVVE